MTNRNFDEWLSKFRPSISSYDYYIDFEKVVRNVNEIKVELNILNSLIGSKNIEEEFEKIVTKYPETLQCVPLLLAVRGHEIYAQDEEGAFLYNFKQMNYNVEQYKVFMRKTGLFDMIANHLVNNLVDYALGIETGLDSNGRKNRGGHQMEDLVEKYIMAAGFEKDVNYFKEMYLKDIEEKWNIDLSALSNQGKAAKRFDFVIKTDKMIYGIETNFYGGGGSKLNETARSYKMLSQEADTITDFIPTLAEDIKRGVFVHPVTVHFSLNAIGSERNKLMPMNKTHDYHEFLEQCKMLYQITKRKISIGLLMFSHYRLDKESEYTLSEEKLEQILNELDSDVFRIDLCTVNKCGRGKQQKLSNKIASNLLKIVKYKGFEGKIFSSFGDSDKSGCGMLDSTDESIEEPGSATIMHFNRAVKLLGDAKAYRQKTLLDE